MPSTPAVGEQGSRPHAQEIQRKALTQLLIQGQPKGSSYLGVLLRLCPQLLSGVKHCPFSLTAHVPLQQLSNLLSMHVENACKVWTTASKIIYNQCSLQLAHIWKTYTFAHFGMGHVQTLHSALFAPCVFFFFFFFCELSSLLLCSLLVCSLAHYYTNPFSWVLPCFFLLSQTGRPA